MENGYERSLVKRVVDRLGKGIVVGDYEDNLLPPQIVLSKKYGVSLTIMREALSILTSRRILDVKQKTGTRVKPVHDWVIFDDVVAEWRANANYDPEFLRNLIELRTFVDPRSAFLAATRANRQHRLAIAACYQNLVHAGSSASLQALAEDELRNAIVEASCDALLKQMGRAVQIGLRSMKPDVREPIFVAESLSAHYGKIIGAIENHDANGAKVAMTQLLTNATTVPP
ncbi:FadR/GntR family transcriptional regulator [Paraburkholderia metrosideri]|uniref:L-lactate dehydrogenase operon regulatory protein n=1 Tax=Paraburkholderia metrosideri TaxID=580937 RepID=A0ABN7HKX1_9BURK|nr:FCD domain-containing protein [Paraburkholderia metrosideri]CAD6524784.1 Putative L-lactate dehydrogenase operon regulatory protein [Paraburkholderia metrosideri]